MTARAGATATVSGPIQGGRHGWPFAASFVVQLMVAVVVVIDVADTAEITGGVVSASAAVVKVKSPETARFPAASRLMMR